MPPHRQSQLNTLLLILTIISLLGGIAGGVWLCFWAAHKYLTPLEAVIPAVEEIKQTNVKLSEDVRDIAEVQNSQTKVLEALADVATKSVRLEMHVERHEEEINKLEIAVQELEKKMP